MLLLCFGLSKLVPGFYASGSRALYSGLHTSALVFINECSIQSLYVNKPNYKAMTKSSHPHLLGD